MGTAKLYFGRRAQCYSATVTCLATARPCHQADGQIENTWKQPVFRVQPAMGCGIQSFMSPHGSADRADIDAALGSIVLRRDWEGQGGKRSSRWNWEGQGGLRFQVILIVYNVECTQTAVQCQFEGSPAWHTQTEEGQSGHTSSLCQASDQAAGGQSGCK